MFEQAFRNSDRKPAEPLFFPMLYKLTQSSGARFAAIDPIAFEGFPKEKELEGLIAHNLGDVLIENSNLMPIRQERAWQPLAGCRG